MTELTQPDNSLPRPNYTFEELEAAVEMAATAELEEIPEDFNHVGTMMIDRNRNYQIFANNAGVYVKALVDREIHQSYRA